MKNAVGANDSSIRLADEKAFVERWWHNLFLRRDALALSLDPAVGKAIASTARTPCKRTAAATAPAGTDGNPRESGNIQSK